MPECSQQIALSGQTKKGNHHAIFILLVSLVLSVPAWADDLGTSGGISGFGQGMGRGFESLQSGIIQQGLMDQRAAHNRQLQAERHQREWEEMKRQHARELAQLERNNAAVKAESDAIEESLRLLRQKRLDLLELKERNVDTYNSWVPGYQQEVADHNARVDKFETLKYAYRPRWHGDK